MRDENYMPMVYPKLTVKQLVKILKNRPKEISEYNWSARFLGSWKMRVAKMRANVNPTKSCGLESEEK
jgi:hypothetical protein